MSWVLAQSYIIGSMCALEGSAAFVRDAVVLGHDGHTDARLILGKCDARGQASGELVELAAWSQLLDCQEALALRPGIAAGGLARPMCWILRANFPDRETALAELRGWAGALVHEEFRGEAALLVVDEARAGPLLEQWSRRAFDAAWRLAQAGQWAQAHEQADLAWLSDAGFSLERVALLALAVERCEGMSAAEDLIAFELNSRRPRPEAQLRGLINRYRSALASSMGPTRGPSASLAPLAARMRELEAGGKIGDLQAWRRMRANKDWVFSSSRAR